MVGKARLGEILVEQGIVTQETIDKALKIKAGGERRLGHILVGMKAITDDQLKDVLSGQSGDPVCNIEEKFSPEARTIMPRYLCTRLGVLPLAFKEDNVLEVAMADPTDYDAIIDVENYTDKVVKTNLARFSDIEREIPKRIPLGLKDIFSPQANNILTKGVAAIALVLAIGVGFYTYEYIQQSIHGTKSISGNYILYQHHDLTLALDDTGKYSLQGHGAYADGLYKISFTSLKTLNHFIEQHQRDFSDQQYNWLKLTMEKVATDTRQLVAQK